MRWLGWCVALGAMVPSSVVRASDPPILVVVEASPDEAADIRRLIGEALGRRVVSLMDEEASRAPATVSVALADSGRRARLCYRDEAGVTLKDARAPGDTGDARWIGDGVVALLQDVRATRWRMPDEILDPFANEPSPMLAGNEIPAEVIDPWERAGTPRQGRESGRGLDAPAPRR